jgi:hypothetical protein
VALQVETDSIVSDAEAVLRRVDALKLSYVARPGSGETLHRLFNAAGNYLFKCCHILQRRFGPFKLSHS